MKTLVLAGGVAGLGVAAYYYLSKKKGVSTCGTPLPRAPEHLDCIYLDYQASCATLETATALAAPAQHRCQHQCPPLLSPPCSPPPSTPGDDADLAR
eukprot:4554140-Prymnesium_polylepis.1